MDGFHHKIAVKCLAAVQISAGQRLNLDRDGGARVGLAHTPEVLWLRDLE